MSGMPQGVSEREIQQGHVADQIEYRQPNAGGVIQSASGSAQVVTKQFGEIGQLTGHGRNVAVSNFPVDPLSRLQLISKATNGEAKPMSDVVGETLSVKWWYVHTVDICDERNGEVTTCPRTVLITEDGEAYAAVSQGIAGSVELLAGTCGGGEVPAGIGAKVNAVKTNRKRTMLAIDWVPLDSE